MCWVAGSLEPIRPDVTMTNRVLSHNCLTRFRVPIQPIVLVSIKPFCNAGRGHALFVSTRELFVAIGEYLFDRCFTYRRICRE